MAELVAGFVCPHAPPIFTAPDAPAPDVRERVKQAYTAIADELAALAVDTLIIVGADHYVLFTPECLPPALICIGDVWGPVDRLPGIERGPLPTHPELAMHLLEASRDAGFDLAVAKALGIDHGVGIPARLLAPERCRILPVYIAAGVEPVIRTRRAYALGAAIGAAVASWPGDERVAIIGSGGISHSVGIPGMGRVMPEFDEWVLDCIAKGDAEALMALPDDEIIRRGGNGALEIRTFLVAMGALGGGRGRVIAYEPVPEWFTGLGFARIDPPLREVAHAA